MIKLVMCLRRATHLSRDEFKDYWLNKHGPFFMKNANAMRAKKYVQSHILETPLNNIFKESRGLEDEFDGVAEVWFESLEDVMEAFSTPEGMELGAALLEDERNFIDHAKSSAFMVEEHDF